MRGKEELKVCKAIVEYLNLRDVLYRFDIAADLPMKPFTAKRIKDTYRHKRGYPDLFIAEPRGEYAGLFVEVKVNYEAVYKKRDGKLKKNKHLEEQQAMIDELRSKGYWACFGLGLKDSIEKIDEYLNIKI